MAWVDNTRKSKWVESDIEKFELVQATAGLIACRSQIRHLPVGSDNSADVILDDPVKRTLNDSRNCQRRIAGTAGSRYQRTIKDVQPFLSFDPTLSIADNAHTGAAEGVPGIVYEFIGEK